MESFDLGAAGALDKRGRYEALVPALRALVADEDDLVANLANAVAAARECLPQASWLGIYRTVGAELVLGPFQGKVACVRIAWGRGVCGTAAAERRAVLVPDVEQFPGHIACDAGSRSEVVVPIVRADAVVGVIDVDSYQLAAFDHDDVVGLTAVAAVLAELRW